MNIVSKLFLLLFGKKTLAEQVSLAPAVSVSIDAEKQRMQAAYCYNLWAASLIEEYGELLGKKLINQRIEPGMSLDHLVASLGAADDIKVKDGLVTLSYGGPNGCLFEAVGETITRAIIGRLPAPPVVFAAFLP